MDIPAFIAKWTPSEGAERANKDLFLSELCDVLGVPRPNPATGKAEKDVYVFEKPIPRVDEDGKATVKRADLYKHGCFLLEAKQGTAEGGKGKGKSRRGTQSWDVAMYDARGQALGYLDALDDAPPFLIVCDIGYVFELYADFDRSRRWNPFPNAQKKRIYLKDLAEHVDTLRAIFTEPYGLDPSRRAEKVTREVAESLAELAKKLEAEGHTPDLVAQFLMRCLFTMFAEDVGLLPKALLSSAIEHEWIPHPDKFPSGIENLWRAMNEGLEFGFVGKLLRFNGGLFAQSAALRLGRDALALLLDAAKKDWSGVEPAIFGTLLERALDGKERHMLGAHYTPRAYVERLVRPTIEEPLREEWENVQTAARKLYQDGKEDDAKKAVRAFHQKLCTTRVLDPACGSGNFLYVTLDLFKRLESEVLALLHDMGERQELLHAEGIRVTPRQFLGIEVKPWAREIAELVLWIGYLQWHYRTRGRLAPPPEPVLDGFKNIECRDAVLAWDDRVLVHDAKGEPVTRWDGVTMKKHPVTGEKVPDEEATVRVYRYVGPRQASWPTVEFVVGNPPFIGDKKMRRTLGPEYVEVLRRTYPDVPEAADYVMYWWSRAAALVKEGRLRRFGFITTNSIVQPFNRKVVEAALEEPAPVSIVFAIPNHPWVEAADGAQVRIAMTAIAPEIQDGWRYAVDNEEEGGEAHSFALSGTRGRIHADLRIGVDMARAVRLRANRGIACNGVQLSGQGFVLTAGEAAGLSSVTREGIVKPYLIGKDLVARPRGSYVIDAFGLSEAALRKTYPDAYQHLLQHVKPMRAQNSRESYRTQWWIHSEPRSRFRVALEGLDRVIVTCRTARQRVFSFATGNTVAETTIVTVAISDAFVLGILSSRAHLVWALFAGTRLGVGDDPRYNHSRIFDTFPFPDCKPRLRKRIGDLAEAIDAHRKTQFTKHTALTITGMYNVLEKLRSGAALTDKERVLHEHGLVSILKQLHDDLDAAVFEAYGWPSDLTDEQILEKLVALNAERAAEEERGIVRWLRPELQNPDGARAATQTTMAGVDEAKAEADEEIAAAQPTARPWPKKLAEQIAAVREQITGRRGFFKAEDVARGFKGAKKKDVEELLDGLAALGVVVAGDGGRFRVTGRRASA